MLDSISKGPSMLPKVAPQPASFAFAQSGLALGSHPKLTLGDKVKVKLVAADLDRKTLDFKFV